MNTATQHAFAASAPTGKLIWTGRVLSGLVIAFMLFDSIIKLLQLQVVTDTFRQMGIPENLAFTIGVIGFVCTVLYAIPRTAVLGAILLTAMLGGGIASHCASGALCSRTCCSASTSASSCGADCSYASRACARCCHCEID
jgi:hypothetical protein